MNLNLEAAKSSIDLAAEQYEAELARSYEALAASLDNLGLWQPGTRSANPLTQFVRKASHAGQLSDNLHVAGSIEASKAKGTFVLLQAWDACPAPTIFAGASLVAIDDADYRFRAAFQGFDAYLFNSEFKGCVDGIVDMGGVHSRHSDISVIYGPYDDKHSDGTHSDGIQFAPDKALRPSSHKIARITLPDEANAAVMINGPRGEIVLDGLDISVADGGRIASVLNVSGTVTKLSLTNSILPPISQINNWANAHCIVPSGINFINENNLTRDGQKIVMKRT